MPTPILFILGSLAILHVGMISLFFYYQKHKRSSSIKIAGSALPSTPPDDTPPALVAALLKQPSRAVGWLQACATLLDLANRGIITIVQGPPAQRFQKNPTFSLELQPLPATLHPHEQAFIQTLFHSKNQAVSSIPLSRLPLIYQKRSAIFTQTLLQEMNTRQLFEPRRIRIRKWYGKLSMIFLVATLSALCFSIFYYIQTDSWLLFLFPMNSAIFTYVTFICHKNYSILTDTWWLCRQNWYIFINNLHSRVAQAFIPMPRATDNFIAYLPFSAFSDTLPGWLSCNPPLPTLPTWFRGDEEHFGAVLWALYYQQPFRPFLLSDLQQRRAYLGRLHHQTPFQAINVYQYY